MTVIDGETLGRHIHDVLTGRVEKITTPNYTVYKCTGIIRVDFKIKEIEK